MTTRSLDLGAYGTTRAFGFPLNSLEHNSKRVAPSIIADELN